MGFLKGALVARLKAFHRTTIKLKKAMVSVLNLLISITTKQQRKQERETIIIKPPTQC